MDLTQLYYFLSVSKTRNFTATATEFFVSQPCISHQIKAFEQELEVELFIRNTRSVELTVAGEIFLQDAKSVIDIMEQSKNKLKQNKGHSMSLNIAHLASPSLVNKKIQADHYCLVTPKDHPAVARISINYSKLASEPFIFFNPEHALTMHQQILQICNQLGFSPRIADTYNLYEDLLYAVESGFGLGTRTR